MPKQKDFRVIPGGKTGEAPASAPTSLDVSELLARARRHRNRLLAQPDNETEALMRDFEDAIEALRRLERSAAPGLQPRVAEYRRLIAELDAELLAALDQSHP